MSAGPQVPYFSGMISSFPFANTLGNEANAILEIKSEWLSLMAFVWTGDIGVHVVRTSRVIIAYTLE